MSPIHLQIKWAPYIRTSNEPYTSAHQMSPILPHIKWALHFRASNVPYTSAHQTSHIHPHIKWALYICTSNEPYTSAHQMSTIRRHIKWAPYIRTRALYTVPAKEPRSHIYVYSECVSEDSCFHLCVTRLYVYRMCFWGTILVSCNKRPGHKWRMCFWGTSEIRSVYI